MTEPPQPKPASTFKISVVWVVPLLALGIAAWMVYQEWKQQGETVELTFSDGSGIQPGQTVMKYKGITIGTVANAELSEDLSEVVVSLQLRKGAHQLFREDSIVWVVQPKISASGVTGLDTLVSGAHLAIRPGTGAPVTSLRAQGDPPAPKNSDEGRAFVLITDQLRSIKPKAPVHYRQVKVGEVETSMLSSDATQVLIRVRVFSDYADLVRADSVFWNATPSPLNISLFGGDEGPTSLESILSGAIGLATPDPFGPPAEDGQRFSLHEEPKSAWIQWRPAINITPHEDVLEGDEQENPISRMIDDSISE